MKTLLLLQTLLLVLSFFKAPPLERIDVEQYREKINNIKEGAVAIKRDQDSIDAMITDMQKTVMEAMETSMKVKDKYYAMKEDRQRQYMEEFQMYAEAAQKIEEAEQALAELAAIDEPNPDQAVTTLNPISLAKEKDRLLNAAVLAMDDDDMSAMLENPDTNYRFHVFPTVDSSGSTVYYMTDSGMYELIFPDVEAPDMEKIVKSKSDSIRLMFEVAISKNEIKNYIKGN